MFRFTELQGSANDNFFRFPHSIIKTGIWATLPKSAQAVLPVIGCHCDKHGLAFPSEERIAGLCGLTCKTARAGIKALEDVLPGFSVSNYTTKRGKRAKSYRFTKQPTDGKEYLAFYRRWIDAGSWYVLHSTPSARAVYPVLRHFGYAMDYGDAMADAEDPDDFPTVYANREYDFCEAENPIVCQYAGITRNSLQPALRALKSAHFIEWDDEQGAWRVYRFSTWYYKPDYLNSELQKRGM